MTSRVNWVSALTWVALLGIGQASVATASAQQVLAPDATVQEITSHLDRDEFAGAKTLTDAALQQYPGDPARQNLAGVIAAQGGDTAAALAYFQSAIRLSPRQAAAYRISAGCIRSTPPPIRRRTQKRSTSIGGCWMSIPQREGLYQSGFLLALQGQFAESRTLLERLPEEIRARPQILTVLAIDLAGTAKSTTPEPRYSAPAHILNSLPLTWWLWHRHSSVSRTMMWFGSCSRRSMPAIWRRPKPCFN